MSLIPFPTNSDRLILFTRYPVAGEVKTRLIPALGPEGSCELHRKMTEHTVDQLRIFSAACPEVFEVRYQGGNDSLMKQWLGSDLFFASQGNGDLGLRLERAFHEAFQSGANRVVIVGSDCPGLTPGILRQAFDGLADHDLVIGPARGWRILPHWIKPLSIPPLCRYSLGNRRSLQPDPGDSPKVGPEPVPIRTSR